MESIEVRKQVLQKIDQLLPDQLIAINDFIDFLRFKKEVNTGSQPLDAIRSNGGKAEGQTSNDEKLRKPGLNPGSFIISEDFDDPLPDSFWLGEE